MSAEPAFVVLMRVHLHFPDAGSLKAKRAELNRVKAHLRQRMGASVAEVGGHEGQRVLPERGQHLLHGGQRADRVAVGALVRREQELLVAAQLVEQELARGGGAVLAAHGPSSSMISAIRMPRSVESS